MANSAWSVSDLRQTSRCSVLAGPGCCLSFPKLWAALHSAWQVWSTSFWAVSIMSWSTSTMLQLWLLQPWETLRGRIVTRAEPNFMMAEVREASCTNKTVLSADPALALFWNGEYVGSSASPVSSWSTCVCILQRHQLHRNSLHSLGDVLSSANQKLNLFFCRRAHHLPYQESDR